MHALTCPAAEGGTRQFRAAAAPWGSGSLQDAKKALAFSQTCAKCTMDLRLGPSPPHGSFPVGDGPARGSHGTPNSFSWPDFCAQGHHDNILRIEEELPSSRN